MCIYLPGNIMKLPYEQILLELHCTSMHVSLEIFLIVSSWVLSRRPKSRGHVVSCWIVLLAHLVEQTLPTLANQLHGKPTICPQLAFSGGHIAIKLIAINPMTSATAQQHSIAMLNQWLSRSVRIEFLGVAVPTHLERAQVTKPNAHKINLAALCLDLCNTGI